MNESQREELKAAVIKELADLERDIDRLQDQVKPIPPDRAIGRLTRMDAINQKSMYEANLRTAKAKRKQLIKVQENLADPDYGICDACEGPIPFQRLLLMPDSRRCVRCLERARRR